MEEKKHLTPSESISAKLWDEIRIRRISLRLTYFEAQ